MTDKLDFLNSGWSLVANSLWNLSEKRGVFTFIFSLCCIILKISLEDSAAKNKEKQFLKTHNDLF